MKFIDEKIENYCISKSSRPSKNADRIEDFTKKNVPMSQMLTGKMEASMLGFLIRTSGAKKVLEIGTFTGYSALAMAENLPKNGLVYTLDINKETTALAKGFWAKSPHGKKIRSILCPAKEGLLKIKDKFDFIFIDADKVNYLDYFKISLKMLTKNGMIAIDNVLWSGKVLDPKDEETKAICALNDFISSKKGFYKTLLPIRDGLFLVKKV